MTSHLLKPPTPGPGKTLLGLACGSLAGLAGLLPWLIEGARLPLQNLWLDSTMPDDMPFALLPVSQYYAVRVVVLLAMGGVLSAPLLRLFRRRRAAGAVTAPTPSSPLLPDGEPPAWPVHAGLLAVHVTAIAQTFIVLGDGLGVTGPGRALASTYFWGMFTGTVLAAAIAQLALHLMASHHRGRPPLGLSLAAFPIALWLMEMVGALSGVGAYPAKAADVVQWLPALIVAGALGWHGLPQGRWRALWAWSALALLTIPPAASAISTVLGTRAYAGNLELMLDLGLSTLVSSLSSAIGPVLLALALAAVIAVPRRFAPLAQ